MREVRTQIKSLKSADRGILSAGFTNTAVGEKIIMVVVEVVSSVSVFFVFCEPFDREAVHASPLMPMHLFFLLIPA